MSTILRIRVDEAVFEGAAAECWWPTFLAHLTTDHTVHEGEVWVHTRADVLAFIAHVGAHGIPPEAITVRLGRCAEAEWNAQAEAAGQTVIGGLA